MTEEEFLDKVSSEFMEEIHSCIPNEWIPSHGYSGAAFHARLNSKNKAYQCSPYFFEGEKKFIHWTSVQSALSIINSREIRLYNLQNSTDSEEFKYAAEQLTIPKEHIDHSKNYLYTFSFCKSTEINNADLWMEYGRDYKGVALEFEIVNSPLLWDNIMLAPVQYELPSMLIQLKDKLNSLKKKYPGIATQIDLGRLIAFHKRPDLDKELEIRLATYFPFDNIEAYWKFCNTEFRFDNQRPRITNYFGLKLYVDNESPYIKSRKKEYDRSLQVDSDYFLNNPKIRLTNVYFGRNCGISNREYYKFKTELEKVIRYRLGYKVELPINIYR